jgi:hypothetical protein
LKSNTLYFGVAPRDFQVVEKTARRFSIRAIIPIRGTVPRPSENQDRQQAQSTLFNVSRVLIVFRQWLAGNFDGVGLLDDELPHCTTNSLTLRTTEAGASTSNSTAPSL